jgi:hypothetical protein
MMSDLRITARAVSDLAQHHMVVGLGISFDGHPVDGRLLPFPDPFSISMESFSTSFQRDNERTSPIIQI